MSQRDFPTPLRWLFFVISVGALISSGIYLGIGSSAGFLTGRILRAVIFGLLGIFSVLMYGTGKKHPGPRSGE